MTQTQFITDQKAEHGTFALFVTPPTPETIQTFFGRNFVFLIDKSGSMTGDPWNEAVRGLEAALATLRAADNFTVCAFDHRMFLWSEGLQPASQQTIAGALAWVKQNGPSGYACS